MSEQTMPSIARIQEFIYSRLAFQTDLEIHDGEAPISATLPLISYNLRARPDLKHKLGMAQAVYQADVKLVFKYSRTSPDEHLLEIGRALDMAGGDGVLCKRAQAFIGPSSYVAGEEEKTYQLGATYDLRVGG